MTLHSIQITRTISGWLVRTHYEDPHNVIVQTFPPEPRGILSLYLSGLLKDPLTPTSPIVEIGPVVPVQEQSQSTRRHDVPPPISQENTGVSQEESTQSQPNVTEGPPPSPS